jgi:hypothetical protein
MHQDRKDTEYRGQEHSPQEEGFPPWRGWATPAKDGKVFFKHTAEDALTTSELTLSGEDRNHGTIKALVKLWGKIQFNILGKVSRPAE